MRPLATDPLTLNFSMTTERVMQRILGISVQILSKRFWSRKTSLLSLSLTLVLVQVFFLAFAPLPLLAWALLEALVPLSFTDCYALAYYT